MKKRILIPALAAALAVFSFGPTPLRGQDEGSYPTNTSLGYKGVVMANFDSADASDEVIADFGSLGLWYYNNDIWTQLSGLNPEGIISALTKDLADEELVADFGATGLWYWGKSGWSQLSGVNADGLFAVDDDGDGKDEIQVDFGTRGVWRYDFDSMAWTQYSGLNPTYGVKTDLAPAGVQEGVWNFPTGGMWAMWTNAAGKAAYRQLSSTYTAEPAMVSAHFISSTGPEDLVADFGSLGLWLCQGSDGSWVKISSTNARRVKDVKFVDPESRLLLEDSAGALYWGGWNGTGMTWTAIVNPGTGGFEIGPGWCESFDLYDWDSGDEEVLIPVKNVGAYLYDYSNNNDLKLFINSFYVVNLAVRGDYYGKGRDSTLAVVFGSTSYEPGLWLHEDESNPGHWGWAKISPYVPDGIN